MRMTPATSILVELLRQRPRWQPVEHAMMWGEPIALPAPCRCIRLLTHPHDEPTCPYIAPDDWYAAEVERMKDRAPA